MNRPAVVVIGDATLDVHVAPSKPMSAGSDVPAVIRTLPGGQGANLAVRLARQGIAVTLVCTLADDVPGRSVRAVLEDEGVRLEAAASEATGVIVVVGGDQGERSMLSHRAPLSPDVADRLAALAPEWALLSGYALLQPDARVLAARLAALPARRVLLGCAVADAALAAWRVAAKDLRPDLVIANRGEVAAARLEDLAAALAITDASGAEATVGDVRVRAAVADGPPAVDTTGAGDAFAAGLVAALADASWPPSEPVLRAAVERGVTLASAVARQHGAQARVAGERPAILDR